MYRSNPRADVRRISQVLSGIPYPAAKWQLVMQVEEYGADSESRAELWALAARSYADLAAVLVALGMIEVPLRPPRQAPPQALRPAR